ncbi:HipA domain-containing protein [Bacillus sp. RHF6]|nr:HipA domain-containing protein [Bacillus sp. RHF6]
MKNPENGQIAMFKLPRENRGEHWAEKICSEIAKIIGFDCAEVDIAIRNGEIGCLSYFFVNKSAGYNHYDGGHFFPVKYDYEKNNGYNIQLIFKVLSRFDLFMDFLRIIVFDALVGNGDRHQDNWGITRHEKREEEFLSPLYDNSASLGRELSDKATNDFNLDESSFIRYIHKGRGKIGWLDKKRENHFLMLKRLLCIFPTEVKYNIDKLNLLTDEKINYIVNNIPLEVITLNQKSFVINYIKKRKEIILKIGDKMDKEINSLLMIWKDEESRSRFVVGELKYNSVFDTYIFKYKKPEVYEAKKKGFKDYPNFPNIDETYNSEGKLFVSIKNRLPKPKRKDYPQILDRYGLESTASELEILEATRGRLATDNFEFIQSIKYEKNSPFEVVFDLAGARYGEIQKNADNININDQVKLKSEPENQYDKNAVAVLTKEGKRIGYVPKYYSKEFSKFLNDGVKYTAKFTHLDLVNESPDEWAKIAVEIIVG